MDKGLPNLLRKLESSGRSGGADLQRCTRALVDVATSTGAVTLASAARAFSACPDAASAQLLWHEFGRTVQALQAHGILSRQMPPVSRGILLGDLPGQTR